MMVTAKKAMNVMLSLESVKEEVGALSGQRADAY